MIVLMNVAKGIEKKTPQNPHKPPKIRIDARIEKASRFIAFEKSIGVSSRTEKQKLTELV